MREWLLIHTGGESLSGLAKVPIVYFTSGDGDEPVAGDLNEAALKLASLLEIRGVRVVGDEKLETFLVSVDGARHHTFSIEPHATLLYTGGPA